MVLQGGIARTVPPSFSHDQIVSCTTQMPLKRPCRSDTCSNDPQESARRPDRRPPLQRQVRRRGKKSPMQHSAGRHRRPPTRSNLRYSGTVGIARERFLLRDFNHTRIVSYGRNDLAAGAFKDRCLHILKEEPHFQIATINDAIEAHQLKLTFETVPESFEDAEGIDIASTTSALFANACRYTRETLASSGILEVYEETEIQYDTQFWGLVHACGAEKLISGEEISELLSRHVECLARVLENDNLVKSFDAEIGKSLIENPYYSAELLIHEYATESRGAEHNPPPQMPFPRRLRFDNDWLP